MQWHTPFLFLYLGMGRLLSSGGLVYFSPGKFLLSHTTILVGSPPTQLFPGLYPVTFTAALSHERFVLEIVLNVCVFYNNE